MTPARTYRPVSGDSPCKECPFRRKAAPGWLGDATPQSFIIEISSERPLPCHPTIDYGDPRWLEKWNERSIGRICAGSLILSANMGKLPRDPAFPRLPPDDRDVFSNHRQFIAHHENAEVRSWELAEDAPKEIRPMGQTGKIDRPKVPEIPIATDRQLERLIAHTRIGRQNAHARAIRRDAQAALAGSDDAPMDSCARVLRDLMSNPDAVGVCAIERSPMNKMRWVLSLLCGHDAWVTSGTKPSQRMAGCEMCRKRARDVANRGGGTDAPVKIETCAARRRRFYVRADIEVELDQRIIDVALTPEWQDSHYKFANEQEVVEHIAFNLVQDRRLTSLDGWADQNDSMAKLEDLDVTDAEEVLPQPVKKPQTRKMRPPGRGRGKSSTRRK